jgi:large subunit ribosomal protein L18
MSKRKHLIRKRKRRKRIHQRIRKNVKGTPERPRLSVYRSNNHIYAQLIDDRAGHTLLAANSLKDLSKKDKKNTKTEQSKKVGQILADAAKKEGIEKVIFDRGGFKYHGRVKALAEGAREKGLKF